MTLADEGTNSILTDNANRAIQDIEFKFEIQDISSNFGHQMAPLALVPILATLPWIALLALSVSIELVSSSARVNSVKFQQRQFVC